MNKLVRIAVMIGMVVFSFHPDECAKESRFGTDATRH
jgi:hypothetical protein